MEVRASYLLVGAVVLALLAGLAAFSVWLVRADVDADTMRYQIAFQGSVTGLQEGGQVQYRGVPVGRVRDIRIDPDNVEQVLVTVDIDRDTPIKVDTIATLEMQGVTGIAYVQLRGGSQDTDLLALISAYEPPRIPSRPSALERVYESGPELLVRGIELADRAAELLDQENMAAITATLHNVEGFTGALAGQSDEVSTFVSSASGAARRVEEASAELSQLTSELRHLTTQLNARVDTVGGDVVDTMAELRDAANGLGAAANELDSLLASLQQPLDDFANTGLYDFTQLMGETRVLVAALNRIAKEFERDPAGFLIGSGSGGFQTE